MGHSILQGCSSLSWVTMKVWPLETQWDWEYKVGRMGDKVCMGWDRECTQMEKAHKGSQAVQCGQAWQLQQQKGGQAWNSGRVKQARQLWAHQRWEQQE